MKISLMKMNLNSSHKITTSKNRSGYVGTSYEDEPTIDSETCKQPKNKPGNFRNKQKMNQIKNGFNSYKWKE